MSYKTTMQCQNQEQNQLPYVYRVLCHFNYQVNFSYIKIVVLLKIHNCSTTSSSPYSPFVVLAILNTSYPPWKLLDISSALLLLIQEHYLN